MPKLQVKTCWIGRISKNTGPPHQLLSIYNIKQTKLSISNSSQSPTRQPALPWLFGLHLILMFRLQFVLIKILGVWKAENADEYGGKSQGSTPHYAALFLHDERMSAMMARTFGSLSAQLFIYQGSSANTRCRSGSHG